MMPPAAPRAKFRVTWILPSSVQCIAGTPFPFLLVRGKYGVTLVLRGLFPGDNTGQSPLAGTKEKARLIAGLPGLVAICWGASLLREFLREALHHPALIFSHFSRSSLHRVTVRVSFGSPPSFRGWLPSRASCHQSSYTLSISSVRHSLEGIWKRVRSPTTVLEKDVHRESGPVGVSTLLVLLVSRPYPFVVHTGSIG